MSTDFNGLSQSGPQGPSSRHRHHHHPQRLNEDVSGGPLETNPGVDPLRLRPQWDAAAGDVRNKRQPCLLKPALHTHTHTHTPLTTSSLSALLKHESTASIFLLSFAVKTATKNQAFGCTPENTFDRQTTQDFKVFTQVSPSAAPVGWRPCSSSVFQSPQKRIHFIIIYLLQPL